MKPDAPINPQLLAIAPNLDADFQYEIQKLFGLLVVRLDIVQGPVLWRVPDYVKLFEENLLDKRFGNHDATYWQSNPAYVFYHVHADHVVDASQSLRNRLSALGILPICGIYIADPDIMKWREFHTATAQPDTKS